MSRLVLGLVSGLAGFSACGVGVDELAADGTGLAGQRQDALEGLPGVPTVPETQGAAGPSGLSSGDVALPQDPIPLRPGNPSDPRLTPGGGRAKGPHPLPGR